LFCLSVNIKIFHFFAVIPKNIFTFVEKLLTALQRAKMKKMKMFDFNKF